MVLGHCDVDLCVCTIMERIFLVILLIFNVSFASPETEARDPEPESSEFWIPLPWPPDWVPHPMPPGEPNDDDGIDFC
jgi:hypothetical protein